MAKDHVATAMCSECYRLLANRAAELAAEDYVRNLAAQNR
jgi:hypothetical protein